MRKFFLAFLDVFENLLIAIVAVILIRTFVIQPFLVVGSSMEPNFQEGNYLLIDELTYYFREPKRGEVIVFKYPKNEKTFFIKRIIGLPGEKVIIENGKIKIITPKGEVLNLKEDYINVKMGLDYFEKELKEGEYFVMGDNRNFSYDSRSWGAVPKKDIIGLVRLRLWPISQVKAFNPPVYNYE